MSQTHRKTRKTGDWRKPHNSARVRVKKAATK